MPRPNQNRVEAPSRPALQWKKHSANPSVNSPTVSFGAITDYERI